MSDHSRDFSLHSRQCVQCEDESPSCNCAADENCVLTSRSCSQCPTIQCNKKPGASGGGVNPGVIAGPVVAVLVIASLVLFWYLRRKKRRDLARLEELAARARKAEAAGFHLSQPGSPSPGSARSLPSARSARSQANSRSSRQSALALGIGPHSKSSSSGDKRRSQRSPLPPAQMNAEYYDESGGHIRVYGGNGHINADPNHPDNRDRDYRSGTSDPFSDMGDAGTFSTRHTGDTGTSTNIIPIQYIPQSESDDSLERHDHDAASGRPKSHAARTLNEARENLFRGGAPQRPARAPGLDLRLNGGGGGGGGDQEDMSERSPADSLGDGGGPGRVRDSYLSGTSGAPSFSSGYTTDLHTDAPKIFTSRHVQLGRFQQAEVVSFGQQQVQHPPPPRVPSPTLSAVRAPYDSTSSSTGMITRTLTPTGSSRGGRYDDTSTLEEMPSPDPNNHPPAQASPTDLRFSMGSLAYRDSISSMGTERYLARPDSSFGPGTGIPPPQPPRQPWISGGNSRESMMSGRSETDSVLGSYPMIPPNSDRSLTPTSNFPQSSSIATLDGYTGFQSRPSYPDPSPNRTPPPAVPPPSYRPPQLATRPQTSASVADSILGSFPFVPPGNDDDLSTLPSARIPDTAGKTPGRTARNTAMSGVSEGLGGFEFRWNGEDGGEGNGSSGGGVPPLPSSNTPRGGGR